MKGITRKTVKYI